MKILEYKGYQANVEYEDGTILIKVLYMRDSLLATCDSAKDVESTFHELIDDYIENCQFLGREIEKPFKGSFNVRIGAELHKKAAYEANRRNISLNTFVTKAIEDSLQPKQITSNNNIAYLNMLLRRHLTVEHWIQSQVPSSVRGAATRTGIPQSDKSRAGFLNMGLNEQDKKWALQ